MIQIILSGCGGAMGRVIAELVKTRSDCAVLAGIDPSLPEDLSFPVFSSPKALGEDSIVERADVVINFSHPSSVEELVAFATSQSLPLVEATTGLSQEQIALLQEARTSIPVFFSANMSLGVNVLVELVRKATEILGGDYDIEIVEAHHNQKIDAPSGTALMIADAAKEELASKGISADYTYDRHDRLEKRGQQEIGIHAIRGGTIVGEHEVIFAGQDEVLTISHAAASKKLFGIGAIRAALYLAGQEKGLYSMEDLTK